MAPRGCAKGTVPSGWIIAKPFQSLECRASKRGSNAIVARVFRSETNNCSEESNCDVQSHECSTRCSVTADRTDIWLFYDVAGPTLLSGKRRQALQTVPSGSFANALELQMLAKAGQVGDRPVAHFRCFDTANVPLMVTDVGDNDEVEVDLLAWSGGIEPDATIVLAETTPSEKR